MMCLHLMCTFLRAVSLTREVVDRRIHLDVVLRPKAMHLARPQRVHLWVASQQILSARQREVRSGLQPVQALVQLWQALVRRREVRSASAPEGERGKRLAA